MSRQIISTAVGKSIRSIARLRGGGSALPGLVVEKIDPKFIKRTLNQLPLGVVIISGTNGKTTTTKIVVELLASAGLKVFTNPTGSNFSRGVVASLISEVNLRGELDADIAVLELDEAWAVRFVQIVKPRYSLLLNVMRDQLDRFGEIDKVAGMLEKIAQATDDTVVLNQDDPRVRSIAQQISARSAFFGTTPELLSLMPTDDDLKSPQVIKNDFNKKPNVSLESVAEQTATYRIEGRNYTTETKLSGIYNQLNASASLALVLQIVPDTDITQLISALSEITPAFGRGEVITIDDQPVELVLVKNPSGFRLAIQSFAKDDSINMVAINDNYADGRDVSWLWDVDFTDLKSVDVVTGSRAYDMALRLGYDEVAIGLVENDLAVALDHFLSNNPSKPKRIYCTYTAMLSLRKLLLKKRGSN
ncbi:Mur ligase family protein [Candidatus Saccharibacteria bacterium]|nr:Mur ligase family protein [Candidatus Saccharibacteria bacterium]